MFEPDELLLTLTAANVEFIVIGGVAVGVHGFVRATGDLAIVPDPDPANLNRLARVLTEIDASQVGTPLTRSSSAKEPTSGSKPPRGRSTSCSGWLGSTPVPHIRSSWAGR
jgi:hypothetical protein